MTISLRATPRRRPQAGPTLDGIGATRHPDAVVWLAGRGHETPDESLHIDFPMALACDQALAMHRAAAAAEVWGLMKHLPGDRFVALPVRGDAVDLVARSLSAWLDDTAQTVVRAARIGLGRDSPTERREIDGRFLENAATGRDGHPVTHLYDRMFAIVDENGFHSRPDALLIPLAPDGAPRDGQAEYAAGLGPIKPGTPRPRVTAVMAVHPHPRVALVRAAWITRRKHGLTFLRELADDGLEVTAGLVFAKDAMAYRNLVDRTATDVRDLAGIGGVPDIDLLPNMTAIDDTLTEPQIWTMLQPAKPDDDRRLYGELSVNRTGDGIQLW